MMAHGHLDLFGAEPGWSSVEDTHIGPVPDMDFDDDEPTGLYVVVEAGLPGETIICAAPPPPVRARTQDQDVVYTCGRTYRTHKQIAADVIRRNCEMDVIAPLHDDEHGIHLGQCTCPGCGSTFTYPLSGHNPRPVRR
jgi:hypothetical protein